MSCVKFGDEIKLYKFCTLHSDQVIYSDTLLEACFCLIYHNINICNASSC